MSEQEFSSDASNPDIELQERLPSGIEHHGREGYGYSEALFQKQQRVILDIFGVSSPDQIDWVNLDREKLVQLYDAAKGYLTFLERPTSLSFRDLWYVKDEKYVLQGVSAYLKPGMLVCAMGPVDSGLSTLLQVLTGRQVGGSVSGDILLGGKPPGPDYASLIGYVPMQDIHYADQTVFEAVKFSLDLRIPYSIPAMFAEFRTKAILKVLNLIHRADSFIGDANRRGLSGGEKRRLSIAVEFAAGHSLFFLDLPTNGLDSLSAMDLVDSARDLVNLGKGIMMSLVQPAPELFNRFDYVLLMCKGVCTFFGPVSKAAAYFISLGYAKPSNGLKSDPDFLSEIMSDPKTHYTGCQVDQSEFISEMSLKLNPKIELRGGSAQNLADSYFNSVFYENVGTLLWQDPSLRPKVSFEKKDSGLSKHFIGLRLHYSKPFSTQLQLLLQRQYALMKRNKGELKSRLGRAFVLSILMGTVFLNLGRSEADARARLGVIFTSLTSFAMAAAQAIPQYFVSRSIFYQQRNAGYFRASAHFISEILTDFPVSLLEAAIFAIPFYALSGLQGSVIVSSQFWLFFLAMLEVNLAARAMVTLISTAMPSETIAQALATVTMIFFMLFSGYLQPADEIPSAWKWLHYISFFRLPFRAMVTNEFDGLTFDCPPTGPCIFGSGSAVLDQYGMLADGRIIDPWSDWASNSLFLFGFYFFSLLFMSMLNYESSAGIIQKKEVDDHEMSKKSRLHEKEDQPLGENAIEINFHDLDYFVPVKGGELQVLRGISGFARPGMCVALMGPSGAGKSTLLDVLALRKTIGRISGSVLVNGHPQTNLFSRVSGYVEQFDSLIPTQTIREAVTTSAELRLESFTEDHIDEALRSLGLEDIQDVLIGDYETGISLELRKKTSIAVEIVANPGLLFMDEPTTGLDSISALAVAQIANRLSKTIPVICTIHQPSAEVFSMFNWLLLLKPGGSVAYFGTSQSLLEKFAEMKNPEQNLADFALGHVCTGDPIPNSKSTTDALHSACVDKKSAPREIKRFAASPGKQILVLTRRMFLSLIRNKPVLAVELGIRIIMGFVLGTLFFQLKNDFEGAQTRAAAFFMSLVLVASLQIVKIASLMDRKAAYHREISSGMFYKLSFWISDQVVALFSNFVFTLIFTLLFYFLSGMQSDRFFQAFLGYWMVCETSSGLVRFFADLCASRSIATVAFSGINSISLIFAGFLITREALDDFWVWLYYSSYYRYGLFFVMSNELSTLKLECSAIPAAECSSDLILEAFSIDEWEKWGYLYALIGMLVLFRLLHLVVIFHVTTLKR